MEAVPAVVVVVEGLPKILLLPPLDEGTADTSNILPPEDALPAVPNILLLSEPDRMGNE